ncbi:hypothetical protein CSB45_06905 [candidate division KSB3 bacterium]|uniref:Uncharacterized protein n=1 Tax=candidate division KSB3 bacterium TaxID=2044937 RepID=A0A2G6E709_9BACT|nr:MAG: hypothetical protein CSB45_06905 [candidate division KSB3 bacterium]PIE30036.1 MAG: hypothetical protein CSA57_05690 [candidate division KSB3 bacterium]
MDVDAVMAQICRIILQFTSCADTALLAAKDRTLPARVQASLSYLLTALQLSVARAFSLCQGRTRFDLLMFYDLSALQRPSSFSLA